MTNTPSRLRKSGLTRKLATTAAMVIASTGVMTAQGTIIYSGPLNLNIPILTTSIDWNSDGSEDFLIGHSGKGVGTPLTTLVTNRVYAETTGSTLILADSGSGLIPNLAAGETVDSSDFFAAYPHTGSLGQDGLSQFFTLNPSDPGSGWNSPNPSQGYFGFQFNPTGSLVLYGWAHLSITAGITTDARVVTLTGFAYDDSGAGITTGMVPEPTAALLGVIGLGLFLGRRRRSVSPT